MWSTGNHSSVCPESTTSPGHFESVQPHHSRHPNSRHPISRHSHSSTTSKGTHRILQLAFNNFQPFVNVPLVDEPLQHSYHHHIFPSKSAAAINTKNHVIYCSNGRSREKGDLHRNSPKIPRLHRIDTSSRGRCNRLLRLDDVVVDVGLQRQRRDLQRG